MLRQDHPTHGELNLSSPRPTPPFDRLDQCDNSQVSMISTKNTVGHLYHKLQWLQLIPHLQQQTGFRQLSRPMVWTSSVLFDVYEQQACGASFYSPDKTVAVELYMIGFVEDTSDSTNDFFLPEPAPLHHYANLATQDAQWWNDTLQLSGRALKDSKWSYHFMYYEFTRNFQPVLKGGTFEPAISIRFNDNTTPTPLKQLSTYISLKTLGVYNNPDGNSTAAFRVLKEKNATHTKTTSNSPLTHTDPWAYYYTIYLTSIVFPFPSSGLHRNQCQHLQKQVKQAILPKCCYNRNTPNAIVYGPSEYGGVEMRSHQTKQGIAQIYSLMTSLRAEGFPRKLALITLAWAQLLAGTQQPLISNATNTLSHLAPMKWIPSIRDFLRSIVGRIEVENLPAVPLQHEHVRLLMYLALDLYSKLSDLSNTLMLSNRTTVDGKFIRSEAHSHIDSSPTPPRNSSSTNLLQTLQAGTSGVLFYYISHVYLHTPLSNHSDDGFTPPMPCSASGSHTLSCPQISYTFANKTPL